MKNVASNMTFDQSHLNTEQKENWEVNPCECSPQRYPLDHMPRFCSWCSASGPQWYEEWNPPNHTSIQEVSLSNLLHGSHQVKEQDYGIFSKQLHIHWFWLIKSAHPASARPLQNHYSQYQCSDRISTVSSTPRFDLPRFIHLCQTE